MKHFLQAPFSTALPAPLYLRTTLMPNDAIFPSHTHSWGEFVYAYNGVVQIMVGDDRYLVPPQYGVWIPPFKRHVGLNRKEVLQTSLYVSNELCGCLPDKSQALLVSPFIRSILEHAKDSFERFDSDSHQRLLRVLLDKLAETPRTGTFLPASEDPALRRLLQYLEENPEDKKSVADLARESGITERTLARKCRKDLGISLTEWRNRMRVVKALALLEHGKTVEEITRQFGYSSASAFIAMFKKIMGTSPACCKNKQQNGGVQASEATAEVPLPSFHQG
ncbi:AraC family transcriptional regulator [Desulfovibrio intestinalis]|uniref:AraC-like DNA-binding protein n=1 Tax=Desulfovibrio intestinalis TaxID=58621 RepID=A0A7W8C5Z0_9BACT|nr:helix-turn-helix transcriptional regulator [Desulfovibrio intestinalis]MBB5144390.1 AraC-like DNA-binding protein [Desulfovibrio intestinalis]